MSKKYLDINGLSRFWEAIKTYVGGKIKQANWTQTNSTADDYIKNKPAISTSEGSYSIKESGASVARGNYSHVEGLLTSTDTTAHYSHVEGYDSSARGIYSHAEGYSTTVWGTASHSEGWATKALGNYSHAQNNNTIAAKTNQTAIGKYNEEDTETDAALQKAFIIGNGTSTSDRSNAYAIDWQGDSEQQGRATTRDMTQEELDDLLGDLPSGIPADYVKKSGDAMTGDLYRKQTNVDASKANNNVSGMTYPAYLIADGSGRVLTRLESVINPNGSIGSYWYVRNYNNAGEGVGLKGISMHMDKTGAMTYNVSDNAKFHTALGESDWVVDGGWKDFSNYRWMWKRWNSGVQELDLIYQFTNSPYDIWNNMQARKVTISWGNIGKYFLDTWYEITQHWEVGSGFAIPATILSKGTSSCECFGLSSASGSQTCRLSVHMVGRWK